MSQEDNEVFSGLPIIIGLIQPFLVPLWLRVIYDSRGRISGGWTDYLVFMFWISLICIFPFVLLTVLLFLFRKRSTRSFSFLLLGGLTGIFILMIPLHYSYWHPFFSGARVSSTASLVFLFAPIYSTITGIIGFLAGLFLSNMLSRKTT